MYPKVKAIITGSTRMVGEGVLLECLQHSAIESLLVINRSPCGIAHPKGILLIFKICPYS